MPSPPPKSPTKRSKLSKRPPHRKAQPKKPKRLLTTKPKRQKTGSKRPPTALSQPSHAQLTRFIPLDSSSIETSPSIKLRFKMKPPRSFFTPAPQLHSPKSSLPSLQPIHVTRAISQLSNLAKLPLQTQRALCLLSARKLIIPRAQSALCRRFSTYQRVSGAAQNQHNSPQITAQSSKPKPTTAPVCSPEDLEYINTVLSRPLGTLYQLDQPLFSQSSPQQSNDNSPTSQQPHLSNTIPPRLQRYKCSAISTASHSDVAIYTFDNKGVEIQDELSNSTTSLTTHSNPIRFKLVEHLQPNLHSNTFLLSLPQRHYNHSQLLHTFDQSTIGYHRYVLLHNILSTLLNSYIPHQQQQLNTLSNSSITLPLDPSRPVTFSFSSTVPKDYSNLLQTTINSLLQFAHAGKLDVGALEDESALKQHDKSQIDAAFNIIQWFQHEIFHYIPQSQHEKEQKRVHRFYAELYGNNEEINVRTTDGKIIDMNEGVDDPELVNKVIKDLGYNPYNLTPDELAKVYSEVERRLDEQDLKLQEVYSDFEGDEADDSSGSDDESFSQRHREELSQLEAIAAKNIAKQQGGKAAETDSVHSDLQHLANKKPKKTADEVGDVDDLLNPNEELLPQDQRLYHGVLPPAAIKEIERVGELDAQYREEYESMGLTREEYLAKKKQEKIAQQLSEATWVPSGNLYKYLKDQAVLNPKNKHVQIQLQLLQTITIDDVISHFEHVFDPILHYTCPQHLKTQHEPVSITISGPDIHVPSIIKQIDASFSSFPATKLANDNSHSIYQLKLSDQKFPLVHFNLPQNIPLSTVHTSLSFISFSKPSLTTSPSSSSPTHSNPISDWTNDSNLITNFSAPTRFLPQTIDTDLLETHFGFSSLHEHNLDDNVIDVGNNDASKQLQDGTPITRSQFHGLDRVTWLKHQLMNKQQALVVGLQDRLKATKSKQEQPPLLDFNGQYNLSLLLAASMELGQPGETIPLHQQFQQLSPLGKAKVNTLLEQTALHVITRLIKQSLQRLKSSDGQHPLSQFDLGVDGTSIHDFTFQPNIKFNLVSQNTGDSKNVLSTVDSNISSFLRYLTTLVQPDLNFFAFQNITEELLNLQRDLSELIASHHSSRNKAHRSTHSPTNTNGTDLEDLILAKTYLPLLIFGNQPQSHPSAITPTTAALTAVHFETIFKRYFLSNPQRSINLSTTPNLYGHSILQRDENNTTLAQPKQLTSREYTLHSDEITQGHILRIEDQSSNAKQHHHHKVHRYFMKRLNQQQKQLKERNLVGILESCDIVFNFETNNKRRRHHSPTLRHLLGGAISLPIPKHYNTNPVSMVNRQNKSINVKKEYETKWIATANSADHSSNKSNTKPINFESTQSQQVFDILHQDGSLDCVVGSNLDYKSSTLQLLQSARTPQDNSPSHQILPHPDFNPNPQEHSLLMSHIKLQQTLPSPGQIYVPLTKQLSRPLFITITDMASQCLELAATIEHVEKRLTPYQLLLLPFIEFFFAKQLPNEFSSHGVTLTENQQQPSAVSDVLAHHGIDLSMKFVYDRTQPTSNRSDQQIKCLINGKCHIHQIDLLTEIIVHSLTKVDLTQNIVDLLTNYSQSLTTVKQGDQFNDDGIDQQYKSIQGQQNSTPSTQHLFRNSPNLSLFHAMSRLTNSTPNPEDLDIHSTFLNLVHGTTSQQQLSTILSTLFTELNAFAQFNMEGGNHQDAMQMVSSKMGKDYRHKIDTLPSLIKTLFFSPAAAQMRKIQHSSPNQQISPLLVLLVNDISETLRCLLLGPAEQQFVHMKLPNKSNGMSNQEHYNTCNNNYFTFNDRSIAPFDVDALSTQLSPSNQRPHSVPGKDKELIDHELFDVLPPQASIPIPTHISTQTNLSTLSHRSDPTYPNIYQSSPIISPDLDAAHPNRDSLQPLYGLSKLHLKTNKHTLTSPIYSSLLTSSLSKLINNTYVSQLTSYLPELSLVSSYLHQESGNHKIVHANQVLSEPVAQPHNILHQGGHESLLSDVAVPPTQSQPRAQQLNSTTVVPLLSVRNCYTLDPKLAEQQCKQNKGDMDFGKNVIRVSQHGLVSFVPQYHFGTVDQLTGDLATTHVSAENFIKGQTMLTAIENNQQLGNYQQARDQNRSKTSSAGVQVQNRPNNFIVAPVSSISTTIAFSGPKYNGLSANSLASSNNVAEMEIGLAFLGQLLIEHVITRGSNNHIFNPQNIGFDPSDISEALLSYLHPFTSQQAVSQHTTTPVHVKTLYNPVDGIFSLQHVKDYSQVLTPSQLSINSSKSSSPSAPLQSNKAVDQSECHNFVESSRVLVSRLIESNLYNSNFDTPPNQLNRFVCGKSTFDQLKVTLLSALKAQSEDLTPPSTSISHTDVFSSNLLLSNITPTPSMILAIKSATPAQVAQVLKTILTFPKAKVSVVGPIDHVPEQVEAAAKTTNGNWSLHIL